MSDGQKVVGDAITLEARVVGVGNPKLKLRVAEPDQDDIGDAGIVATTKTENRDVLFVRVVPAPAAEEKGKLTIQRLYGCHVCGPENVISTWVSGPQAEGQVVRGVADRKGYFTVFARLSDGTFASADPPIIVSPIIPPGGGVVSPGG